MAGDRLGIFAIDFRRPLTAAVPESRQMPWNRLSARIARLGFAAALAAVGAGAAAQGTPVTPAAAAASASANRLDDILARGVLRVGTTGDYKPFSYRVGTSDR